MGMTPEKFFFSFVLGNYGDFTDQSDCIRFGFNAAIAASHMADHYYSYNKINYPEKVSQFEDIGKYIEYVSNRTNGDFKDIRDIANAYKHLYTRTNAVVSSAGAIEMLEINNGGISEITYSYCSDKTVVVFTRKTGERRELLPSLENVIAFWSEEVVQAIED